MPTLETGTDHEAIERVAYQTEVRYGAEFEATEKRLLSLLAAHPAIRAAYRECDRARGDLESRTLRAVYRAGHR